MKIFLAFTIYISGILQFCYTQNQKVWIRFSDKNGVEFSPTKYFDAKALDRRHKLGLPLFDFSDLPIREDYYKKIELLADSITGTTRWFNAVACYISSEKLDEVKELNFVKEVVPMNASQRISSLPEIGLEIGEQELLTAQTSSLEGYLFDSLYTGKGIRICIIDAGFPNVESSKLFEHIRNNNRIKATWDFKKNRADVYRYNSHGTSVLSCIAGVYEGQKIGLATDAEFLLARTERTTYEGLAEEEDWLEAVEWADKNGADIINSSLGYTNASHFVEDMDGNSTIITRAANLAARKGILVVNAAGNEGETDWKFVAAPGDADSALTVGGINPWTGLHTAFSSYGPNANHHLKPNVAAFGHAVGYDYGLNYLGELTGTSFASPLVAGFAACAWQSDTSLTNMELFQEIEKSGAQYPYYDYATGYGLPKASYFMNSKKEITPTFLIDTTGGIELKVKVKEEYFIENKMVNINQPTHKKSFFHIKDDYTIGSGPIPKSEPEVLYFHIENKEGYLSQYEVIAVNQIEVLSLLIDKHKGTTLRFSYKGFTQSIKL